MPSDQLILIIQFQNYSQQFKNLMCDILMHMTVEFLNVGPAPLDHLGLGALLLGDEFLDVVGFQVVIQPRENFN